MNEESNNFMYTILTVSVDDSVHLVSIHLSKRVIFIRHLTTEGQIFSL